jgi:sec-independent protein translocase protein TatB
MFDIAWSELLIIAVVALIFIGPKDLPKAMRTAARWMRAGQRLAREFQGHVDELVREAELEELRDKARQAASRPFATHLDNIIDPKREIFEALTPPSELHSPVAGTPPDAPAGAAPGHVPASPTPPGPTPPGPTPVEPPPEPSAAQANHVG